MYHEGMHKTCKLNVCVLNQVVATALLICSSSTINNFTVHLAGQYTTQLNFDQLYSCILVCSMTIGYEQCPIIKYWHTILKKVYIS